MTASCAFRIMITHVPHSLAPSMHEKFAPLCPLHLTARTNNNFTNGPHHRRSRRNSANEYPRWRTRIAQRDPIATVRRLWKIA